MAESWGMEKFRIGINMAGAISAGAYTAGVLDFLMEALEEWQKAKEAYIVYLNHPTCVPSPEAVPLHDVAIEVFSGASAGGMCAAIASVMVQQPFTHIKRGDETGTTNTFYESWVNKIDIRELLQMRDIVAGKPLASLLDCTIIDEIADYALAPRPTIPRPFISDTLTLFLTLTNVRGVPYRLYNDPAPTIEEFTAYYGDRLRFEITHLPGQTSSLMAKPLPVGLPDEHAWPLLKETAKATGAFPIFLAPRVLPREVSDYRIPVWESITAHKPLLPAFDSLTNEKKTWQTLNVDGGVIDNNPFQLAHDFLVSHNPHARGGHNPRDAAEANCAVITIAPFPAQERFDPNFNLESAAAIGSMLGRLVSVLISQSRFSGESLEVLTGGTSFSRFVIAPSDPEQSNRKVLQCGLLGAFGGFFERGFRVHDFLLGRRNCQRFLTSHFVLPTVNPIIALGLQRAAPAAEGIRQRWCLEAPDPAISKDKTWMPIVPLCGTAATEVNPPQRASITGQSVRQIVSLLVKRLKVIGPFLLTGAPSAWALKLLLKVLLTWPVSFFVKRTLLRALVNALRPNITD